ncbi:TetR/AcrR family transcriptional regulator [Limimaricola litoreus]|uniref:TetR/AcrR family transcriptional regulator n=1 Tax=Limimaricola litoreus TaxID=2955316 RepID=A0A9X2FTM6_9RHOB|nr:TetR/AcrR family transcriptional regulator [Limimaricola litoreus]
MSDLARSVGLSRATLIQRFGDREAILHHMAAFEAKATRAWIDTFPIERGRTGLWRFLEEIVESMGAGDGFSARVQIAALEARDPVMRHHAQERYRIVQDAIEARLSDGPDRREAAEHLHGVIAGATMQWVVSDGSLELSDFVLRKLRFAFDLIDERLTLTQGIK